MKGVGVEGTGVEGNGVEGNGVEGTATCTKVVGGMVEGLG